MQQGIPKHKSVGWGCFKVWFCSRYVGKILLKLEEVVFAWFCVELCVYHSSRTRWWFEKNSYSPSTREMIQLDWVGNHHLDKIFLKVYRMFTDYTGFLICGIGQ